jgi:uncharacterized protein YjbI with pentapeptide repeats
MDGSLQLTRVFTAAEKRDLAGQVFRNLSLEGVDFSGANLREASFVRVSLRGCDFRTADLRGADFLGCDLRQARLDQVVLGDNRFHGSCLANSAGLSDDAKDYVSRRGGSFIDWADVSLR